MPALRVSINKQFHSFDEFLFVYIIGTLINVNSFAMSVERLLNAKTSCKNILNAFIRKNGRLAIWPQLKLLSKFRLKKHQHLFKILLL